MSCVGRKSLCLSKNVLTKVSMREKYPNTEFFSSPYFPAFGLNMERYLVSLRFSPNVGKYGLEKTPYLDTFHTVKERAKTI